MKKKVMFQLLVAIFIVVGCVEKRKTTTQNTSLFPPELVDFVLAKQDPVFEGTGTGTWDNAIRERGYILKEEGIFKMWYTGYSGQRKVPKYLGYATSEDGFYWERYSESPIIDKHWVEDVQVVKHDQTYFMVAEGVGDIAHLLSSPDGIHWDRLGDLDIRKVNGDPIDPGSYGTPTLWIEDEKWYLYYERRDLGIWLAVSTDQQVWTNVQDEPVIERGPGKYDAEGVAINQIIKYQGKYYGYYHGTPEKDWSSWNSNVAVSDDLIHWTKYENNPIIDIDGVSNNYSSPILVDDGSRYRLYTMHESVRVYYPKNNNN